MPCRTSYTEIGSLLSGTSTGGKLNTTCLVDPDPSRQTISLQMCGNGIVEQNEECDPGLGSNSTCCDQTICKFRSGAVCDPGSSACCTSQCQFAPLTQVCRAARDARCDTAETCTGSSAACPADVFAPNGRACGSGLACASGQCTSLSRASSFSLLMCLLKSFASAMPAAGQLLESAGSLSEPWRHKLSGVVHRPHVIKSLRRS